MRKPLQIGEKFGRLTILDPMIRIKGKSWHLCQCDCGTVKLIQRQNLIRQTTKSCGCLQKERASLASTTHGQSNTPTHWTWKHILGRCYNPNEIGYSRYGGRGITVCEEWKNSFKAFYKDMGEKPKGKTIERINNEGNYEKSNCRWATKKEQNNNTRNNINITYQGKTQTLSLWCDELNLKYHRTYDRITKCNFSYDRAFDPAPVPYPRQKEKAS